MAIRHIKHELEAKLTSKTSGFFSKPGDKIKRKPCQDGGERLKLVNLNCLIIHVLMLKQMGIKLQK